MLSVIVTVVLFSMMLLIVTSLVFSASHERQRHRRSAPTQPLLSHPQVILHLQNAMALNTVKPASQPAFTSSSSWYIRRHILVLLGFLLMVSLTLLVHSGLADDAVQNVSKDLALLSSSLSANGLSLTSHSSQVNASQQLVCLSQLDPSQYGSSDEYNSWAYSACSAAAMTEVFNAYGRHFRVTDVLQVEAQIGAITPQLGLLDPSGIQQTAAQFSFKTTWGNAWTLDQVIDTANHGKPVIVSFPPDRYEGGHILVVTGGNDTFVYLADTSLWNRHSLTRTQFLQWWEGFGAVITPS